MSSVARTNNAKVSLKSCCVVLNSNKDGGWKLARIFYSECSTPTSQKGEDDVKGECFVSNLGFLFDSDC
uniref:Uncharacterized protein n=1 Tax=Cucumis melo TaxID=3656 RepID=A0A9I9EA93_CUCME